MRLIVRGVLAYVVAMPVFVIVAARETEETRTYTLTVRMATDAIGLLQVYANTGHGFSEGESYVAPLTADGAPHDYSFGLPSGRYHMLRIDPGTAAGRYSIFRIAVTDSRGTVIASPPLSAIQPLNDLQTVERTPRRLTVVASQRPGLDPQLLWAPASPLDLYIPRHVASRAGSRFVAAWFLVWAVLEVGARIFRPRSPAAVTRAIRTLADAGSRDPRLAIAALALTGTVLSAYPVLFMDRSLLSPNNGLIRMLYETMPFTPGSADTVAEDTRGSDVTTGAWLFVPFARIQRAALREGEFALWNRYNAGGRPLWGQGYGFLLDPLHLLSFAVPDLSWSLDLKFLAHRFVFALGIGLLTFALIGAWVSPAVVAASVPFLGLFTYRFNHPQTFVLTYVPWVLLAFSRVARGDVPRPRRAAAAIAITSALTILASTPKETAVLLPAAWLVGVAFLLCSDLPGRTKLERLLWIAVAGVATTLITAPDWLVFADSLRQSETVYDRPYALFAGLPHAVSFFLGPVTFGPVLPGFHALLLVGLVAAVVSPRRVASDTAIVVCALAGLAFIAMAFGAVPARVLVRVPLLDRIGHMHDVGLTAATPFLLVLCAAGLHTLLEASAAKARLIAAAVGVVAILVGLIARHLAAPGAFEPLAGLAVLSSAALLPLVLGGLRNRTPSLTRLAAILLILLVLLLPGGLHVETPFRSMNAVLFQPRFRVAYGASSPVLDEIRRAGEPSRTMGVGWVLFPGSQGVYGLEGINGGAEALQLPAYERLADAAGLWRGWFYFVIVPEDRMARAAPFLDMMNVRYVLMQPNTHPAGVDGTHVPDGDRLSLGERPSAWPRAFFVGGASTYSTPDDLMTHLAAAHRPIATVQSDDPRARESIRGLPPDSGTVIPATAYVLTTNTTRFHLRTPSRGVAVLTETFYADDFVVTVNGRRSTYFRVNHAFKGIPIPTAGEWDVVVAYRPVHWHLSLAMGAAGLIVLLWLSLSGAPASDRRAPRATPADSPRTTPRR